MGFNGFFGERNDWFLWVIVLLVLFALFSED